MTTPAKKTNGGVKEFFRKKIVTLKRKLQIIPLVVLGIAFLCVKEFFRKKIVTLKRKPQIIPLVVLGIAFLFYSLNMTHVSNTTAKLQRSGMGLCGFCTMLFSMLSFVCFLNAFPHRKKPNVLMLVLLFAMLLVLLVCDTLYMGQISNAITSVDNPIVVDAKTIYITKAYNMLRVHRVIVVIGAVLTGLVPQLRKLLRKIDTSLPVEENTQMGEIMLTGDD